MGIVHMTVGPHMTHRVVEIIREKLFEDGNPKGADEFMRESFGFTEKITSKVMSGEYVMVFRGDGSGELKPREDVTPEEIEAMSELPELWTPEYLIEKLRSKIKWFNKDLVLLVKNKYLVIDLHKEYTVEIGESVVADEINKAYGVDIPTEMTMDLKTKDIIKFCQKAHEFPNDYQVRNLLSDISIDVHAGPIIAMVDGIYNAMEKINKFDEIGKYIKNNYDSGFDFHDDPAVDLGALLADPDKFTVFSTFNTFVNDLRVIYSWLNLDEELQEKQAQVWMASKDVMGKELNRYIQCEMDRGEEKPFGPVKPKDHQWDAGWISPEGGFFAECGAVANMIHINLANQLKVYLSETYPWANPEDRNFDRTLEEHGWLKFHNMEVNFAGYDMRLFGKGNFRITMKQQDKLHDYAKAMGYERFLCGPSGKVLNVKDIFDTTDEQWEDLFEY